MSANDVQVGGGHYMNGKVQHWDWAQHIGYLEGNATKYIARHKDKHGLQDIEKALHYIQKIVERDYPDYTLDWNIGLKDGETDQEHPKAPNAIYDGKNLNNPYANIDPDA